ncbi:YjhX family toxin [Albimonas sp. CAU 1670]|uniref:YjhX family toxin n=1 Tax=Albimonas sp. CAU 1670 TaxID=3032599 RepID=UPI0023DC89AC|nr:YjhX family toxin [Albimonas sp. CAU 1670]MDF2234604.1 YjhX family toxin [Albimonas sp. CAU 1670]
MNISKREQRVLHALARGGALVVERAPNGKPLSVDCLTREGWRLEDGTMAVFRRLVRRRWIVSHAGGPYRLTRAGRLAVRAQPDNRA